MKSIVLTVKVACVAVALVLAGCGNDGSNNKQSFTSSGSDDSDPSTTGDNSANDPSSSDDNSTGTDPGTSQSSKCLTVCAAIDQVNAAGSDDNCASSDPDCVVPPPPACQTYCTSDPTCQLVCDPFLQDGTCNDPDSSCPPSTGNGATDPSVPLCHWECAPAPIPCSSNDPTCPCPDNSTDCHPTCNQNSDCPAGMACASDGQCKPCSNGAC